MATPSVSAQSDYRHDAFLAKLPTIERSASYAFRSLTPERKQEAIDEACAAVWNLWHGMVRRGVDPSHVSATALAHWGCCRVRGRRRVSCEKRGGRGKRDLFDAATGISIVSRRALADYYLADGRASVPDTVATKLDFETWLETRSPRDQEIYLRLAAGATTTEVAQQFGISMARVSQIRREAQASWEAFRQA